MENNKDDKVQKKSPNLGVISSDTPYVVAERRNLPRLCLTAEQFRLSTSRKLYSIYDLTERGMGIWLTDSEDRQQFVVGWVLDGHLNLKGKKFAVQAKIRNLRSDRIGCEFQELSPAASQAITQFLDPKMLGSEMKLFPASDRDALWYHGPSGTDLLLKRVLTRESHSEEDQFHQLTLYVLGSFIHWDKEEGVSTGRVTLSDEKSELRGIIRLEALLLYPDSKTDLGKLSIAKNVILSSNLPQDLKTWCIRQLER
jgi:hypothetical protein